MNPKVMKLHQGTAKWFEMVGLLMSEAASRSGLDPHQNVSVLERYTDGVELSNGLYQGFRFDIVNGKPSFRVGVMIDETADIVMHVSAEAARRLNLIPSTDPEYLVMVKAYHTTGKLAVDGDLSKLGEWFVQVHDLIVDRTR